MSFPQQGYEGEIHVDSKGLGKYIFRNNKWWVYKDEVLTPEVEVVPDNVMNREPKIQIRANSSTGTVKNDPVFEEGAIYERQGVQGSPIQFIYQNGRLHRIVGKVAKNRVRPWPK